MFLVTKAVAVNAALLGVAAGIGLGAALFATVHLAPRQGGKP